jgi:hypothetical protein
MNRGNVVATEMVQLNAIDRNVILSKLKRITRISV